MGDPATDCPYRRHRTSVDTENPNLGGRARRACEFGQHGGVIYDTLRRRMPPRGVWTPRARTASPWPRCFSGAADALVAVSLAGSLFFSLSPEASRQQVLLYLVINMAPFALLAPLVGPGHRPTSGSATAGIAVVPVRRCAPCAPPGWPSRCSTSASTSSPSPCSIAAKAYGRRRARRSSRASSTSRDQLVAANSRLARLNVIAGAVGGAHRCRRCSPSPIAHGRGDRVAARAVRRRRPLPRCAAVTPPRWSRSCRPASSTRSCTRRRSSPRRGRSRWSVPPSGSSSSASPSPCAARASRRGCTARPSPPTASARSPATPSRPLLRRRYGEDRLTAGVARRARRSSPPSAPSARPGRSCCWCRVVLGGAASVARQGFDALVQTRRPDGDPRPRVRPLRDPVPARLGRRRDRRDGDRHPDPLSLAIVAVGPAPGGRALRAVAARGQPRPTSRTRSTRSRWPAAASTTPSSGTAATSTASPSPSSPASSTSPGPRASTLDADDDRPPRRAARRGAVDLAARHSRGRLGDGAARRARRATRASAAPTAPVDAVDAEPAPHVERRRAIRARRATPTTTSPSTATSRSAIVSTDLRPVLLRAVDLDLHVDRVVVRAAARRRRPARRRRAPARRSSSS